MKITKEIIEAIEEIVTKARECGPCEGTGRDPLSYHDACHRCGGVGEIVECQEFLFSFREFLKTK